MRKISPLKVEIIKRGLIQADVAASASISESRLSRILNGRVKPLDYELKKLAQAMHIDKSEIKV